MSMIKVTYSSDISSTVGVGGEIVKSASELGKQASTIFHMEYEQLKPPDGMTGIHLVALGDAEAYGMNRNGDLFSKEACVKYHDTFVKYGHVYQHHQNKNPDTQGLGTIKAAAYNPDMHRIELYIWADNEKSHDHLERLEKTGEVSFSMACKVPYDRCSICGAIRKQAGDKGECDHIKYQLGKVAEDGRQIGTYNDEPTWFDISFVGRPADRIAWNLKVASDMPEKLTINSSVKQAEVEGYVLPDDLAIESPSAMRKQALMKDLASMHDSMRAWLSKSASPSTKPERYRFELRKVAGASVPDDVIGDLRAYDPQSAFAAMADSGVVMDVPSFFKYAFGPDYCKVEKYVPEVEKILPGTIDRAVKEASCARICNESRFDAASDGIGRQAVSGSLRSRLAKCAAARCFGIDDGVTSVLEAMATGSEPVFQVETEKTAASPVDETGADGVSFNASAKLAEKYAMYKLAGIDAVLNGAWGASLDRNDVVAVFAAQDLKRTQTGSTK